MDKPIKFLELEKLILLQDIISFLDTYVIPLDEEHEIRVNGVRNDEITNLLFQLGGINQTRKELLDKIINHKERKVFIINDNIEEKQIFSGNEEETVEFVKRIVVENEDEDDFLILNIEGAKNYIDKYCDNLDFIGDL